MKQRFVGLVLSFFSLFMGLQAAHAGFLGDILEGFDGSLKGVSGAAKDRIENERRNFENWVRGGARGPNGEFEVISYRGDFNRIGENASFRVYSVKVLNFFLGFVGLVSMSAIIFSGFLYITAGGDDGTHEKAKKIFFYSGIGIIVILVSFAFVNTIITHSARGTIDLEDPGQIGFDAGAASARSARKRQESKSRVEGALNNARALQGLVQ